MKIRNCFLYAVEKLSKLMRREVAVEENQLDQLAVDQLLDVSEATTTDDDDDENSTSDAFNNFDIIENICSYARGRTWKALRLSCRDLNKIVRPMIWRRPDFAHRKPDSRDYCAPMYLNADDWHALAHVIKAPIKVLSVSQINQEIVARTNMQLIDFINSFFDLDEFILDQRFKMLLPAVTCINYMAHLPVKTFNTDILIWSPPDWNSHFNDLTVLVTGMASLPKERQPKITIKEKCHARLTIEEWAVMVTLPVVQIHAWFMAKPEPQEKYSVKEYCRLIGTIANLDKLVYHMDSLPPWAPWAESFRLLDQAGVKIASADLIRMDNKLNFMAALEASNQRPIIKVSGMRETNCRLHFPDLKRLFKYRFVQLNTGAMKFNHNTIDEFLAMIIKKHREEPIEFTVAHHQRRYLKDEHRAMLKAVGLGIGYGY